MKKPTPKVRVITWSTDMRLKRRHEVLLTDGGEWGNANNEVPVARFSKRTEANRYAQKLRAFLKESPR